jgi:hypothetical protein
MVLRSFRHHVRGSSLLDELTAVVVLSVGLLGLAGLQGRVQTMAADAENQTLALTLAQNQLERLRGIAGDPGGTGYEAIAGREATIGTIGEQRLDTPFALHVEVARFRLQGETGAARYVAAGDDVPLQANIPEFKRVNISVRWTSKTGGVHGVALPGIVSPAVF